MKREWKPGDVGVSAVGERFIVSSRGECFWSGIDKGDWSGLSGTPAEPDRPLVVIDPEDREQVERLTRATFSVQVGEGQSAPWESRYPSWRSDRIDDMQDALREFANPKPSKPSEPTGLGAVVEDADGRRWLRAAAASERLAYPWAPHAHVGHTKGWAAYTDVAAVRVLSEGVQP